jgi:hydroxymethylpyrimidine/phosphomethylpyrimidine kinase
LTARPARILIIAGSDSSGGAGLQADIKTASAFGCYAMTAVTAVTVQDTKRVHAIHSIPPAFVRDQIVACLNDIGADAIKIGMLGSAATVRAVAAALEKHARNIPIVLDPVMVSTSGTALMNSNAIETLKNKLIPLASVITPNLDEAARLLGVKLGKKSDPFKIATRLLKLGAKAVLVTGVQTEPGWMEDILALPDSVFVTRASLRIDTRHTHGTGCTLATAMACCLALGLSMEDALERSHTYVYKAIETAPGLGKGAGPLNHMH